MSNAAHAVVTVVNDLQAKAVVVITSEDYPELERRVARVKSARLDSVTLDGVDTSDLTKFPEGGEVSRIPLVADKWQRLAQLSELVVAHDVGLGFNKQSRGLW
ncbi:phage tail protein [Comamonas testosteroni]|nr:phage tail protein [Comamonas testosteroni]